jgi:hypothetical protein
MTFTIDLEPETLERLRAVAAARGQDPNRYAAAVLMETLDREAERVKDLREGQELLTGSARPLAESFAALREMHGWLDLSHRTREQLAAEAEAILTALPPEKVAEAERLGLI